MSTNPYQSPMTSCVAPPNPSLTDQPTVDGKCLVVTSGTVLPPICVETNRPVSEDDLVRREFEWCPPWVALLILLSGLLLILVYFLVRKKCSLTFGLDRQLRKKRRRRTLFKSLAAVVLFFAIPVSAAVDVSAAPIIVIILFLVAVISLFIGNSPLSVVKARKGRFWIKGFSPEFLAAMEQRSAAAAQ